MLESIVIILNWALINLSQVLFASMLYVQLVEWMAMYNLIQYQIGKSIGQVMYELENEVIDEPLRRRQGKHTLKQLNFRKLEISLYRKLRGFGIIYILWNIFSKSFDLFCAFLSQFFPEYCKEKRSIQVLFVVKRYLQTLFYVFVILLVAYSGQKYIRLRFVMKKKHNLEFLKVRKSMFLQFYSSAVFLLVVIPNNILFIDLRTSKLDKYFMQGLMEIYHRSSITKELKYLW